MNYPPLIQKKQKNKSSLVKKKIYSNYGVSCILYTPYPTHTHKLSLSACTAVENKMLPLGYPRQPQFGWSISRCTAALSPSSQPKHPITRPAPPPPDHHHSTASYLVPSNSRSRPLFHDQMNGQSSNPARPRPICRHWFGRTLSK